MFKPVHGMAWRFCLSFIMIVPATIFAKAAAGSTSGKTDYKIQNLVKYVNPFCGTSGDGNCYPGASAPFGMVQWSPDVGKRPVYSGYNYRDSTIYDFSMNQLSGAGCVYAGDFGFMPLLSSGLSSAPAGRYAYSTPFLTQTNPRNRGITA